MLWGKSLLERRTISHATWFKCDVALREFMLWAELENVSVSGVAALDAGFVKRAHIQLLDGERAHLGNTLIAALTY